MRAEITKEIDELRDKHCTNCEKTSGFRFSHEKDRYCINECPIGKKFKGIGDRLLDISREKTDQILSRGKDMTTSDVKLLIDRGVTRKEISKRLGIDTSNFIKTREKTDNERYIKQAKENNIPINTFYGRIYNQGMSKEDASTIPVKEKRNASKYPDWVFENLKKNNITNNQFYARMQGGWTLEKASTHPVRKKAKDRN